MNVASSARVDANHLLSFPHHCTFPFSLLIHYLLSLPLSFHLSLSPLATPIIESRPSTGH